MTVAEIRTAFPRGYKVQTILERYLPSRRSAAKRNQRGSANHAWKGDGLGYAAAHLRIYAVRGHASAHVCVDCDGPATDWSYIGGRPRESQRDGLAYSPDPMSYAPRCKTCHHNYDFKGRRPNGQFVSREEVMPHVS